MSNFWMTAKSQFAFLSNEKFLQSLVLLCIVLSVTFLAFSPSLHNQFITNDDPNHLINNELVRSMSLENLSLIFSQTLNRTYIPLTTLSFAVEYYFFGLNSFFYHLNNVLLHLVVTALLFIIARRWFKFSPLAAALAALVFGIHPMHVESVAWITERKDVLYAFFYLAAVERYCAYIHQQKRRDYYGTIILALLSILAKPMALSLPLVFWVLDWYFRRDWTFRLLFEKVPHLLIIIPVTGVTYILNARMVGTTPLETALSWIWSLMFYLQKFLFPDYFLTIYSLPQPVALTQWTFVQAVVLFLVSGFLLFRFQKQRLVIFAALYYFVSIFFLLRFDAKVDVNFVADRFMYLPSLGICFLIGVGFEWLIKNVHAGILRKFVLGGIILVYLVLGVKTFQQTKIWGDGVLLWSGVVKHYPDCFHAYDHRGYAYAQRGQFPSAVGDYNQALRLKPLYMPAYHNRALAYSQMHKDEKALADFDKVFEMNPHYARGYFNRGIFYAQRGESEKAIGDYTQAIVNSNHFFIDAYSNRGTVYLLEGKMDEALKDFDRALELDKRDIFARNNRAIVFVNKGELESALADLNQAVRFAPKDVETYFNRGLVYVRLEKFSEAFLDFKKVLELEPRHKMALQKALEIQKKTRE